MKYFIDEKLLDISFNNKYTIIDDGEILNSKAEWFNKKIKIYYIIISNNNYLFYYFNKDYSI